MDTSRPGRKVSRSRGPTIEVCAASTELRELTLIAATLVGRAVAMIEGDAPPDGVAFYFALVDARRVARKARDLARKVDNRRRGRPSRGGN